MVKNVILIEDTNLAKLLAAEICGDPNNLNVLTKENLEKVTQVFSRVTFTARPEEEKITNLKGLEVCVNLEQIHLTDHAITDLSPLYDLEKLKVVNLRKNNIEDIYPLAEKESIEVLGLGQNKIIDASILKTLTGLRQLYIQENPIRNKSLIFLNDLPHLREVCLWETNENVLSEVHKYKDSIKVLSNKDAA